MTFWEGRMPDLSQSAAAGDEITEGSVAKGCVFAMPISLALWGLIVFCVEKIV